MSVGVNDEKWEEIHREYKRIENKNEYEMPDEVKGYKWEAVYPYSGDSKYCRTMVCHEHKLRRPMTFSEFYGGGVVD